MNAFEVIKKILSIILMIAGCAFIGYSVDSHSATSLFVGAGCITAVFYINETT